MSWRDELPDPLRTSDGRLVATRAELDAAQVEVIHGGSDAGRFSMMFGLMGWDVVDGERLPRLAHEARDLLTDRTGYVTGPLSAGTRAMLERIGALAIERRTGWSAPRSACPPVGPTSDEVGRTREREAAGKILAEFAQG